jgi:hypothetical protein
MNYKRKSIAKGRPRMLLGRTLEERLAAYALCAGTGMLTFTQPAEAQIDYTPVDVKLQCGPHVQNTHFCKESALLDFDGTTEFQLLDGWFNSSVGGTGNYFSLGLVAKQPGAAVAVTGSFQEAVLQSGESIGPNQEWKPGKRDEMGVMFSLRNLGCFPSGGWQNIKGGFLGLRFKIDGQTHYGWAEVSTEFLTAQPCAIRVWLAGYAYNTAPDEPILAGQKTGNDAEEVAPATLGVLSFGALGLDLWRTNRPPDPEAIPK